MAKKPGRSPATHTDGGVPAALSADALCRLCDPESLGFKTTEELKDPHRIIGQDRAVEAIRFGVGITKEGYNMFALGPSGTGKYSVIRQFLDRRAAGMATLTKGFSTGETSFVAPFDYSRLLYATALGFFIFGETPDAWSAMGALIIVASGTYIARRALALTRARLSARRGGG